VIISFFLTDFVFSLAAEHICLDDSSLQQLSQRLKASGTMTLNDVGSMNVDVLFERLVQFVRQELNVEDRRHIAEQLSEEELAIFDVLIQPDVALSEEDKAEVKKVVRELLETLKHEKLVLDWRKKQQAQAAVKKTVRDMFYYALPASYTEEICERLYAAVYQHIYDSYFGEGRSVYAA